MTDLRPGAFVQRDPLTGRVWQELSRDDMAFWLLRSRLGTLPSGAVDVYRIDDDTVGVADSPAPFCWEDAALYAGWHRPRPSARIVAAATLAGVSLVAFAGLPRVEVARWYRAARRADNQCHKGHLPRGVLHPGV
jgi:hypothetical protein